MAEQIISPGVFTRENDLSFLPAGVQAIGAAVVGPTEKGPAFVPTVVRSFSEYQRRFGSNDTETYVPQTVREYLKNAGSVTVTRVLGGSGYTFASATNQMIALVITSSVSAAENVLLGVVYPSKNTGTPDLSLSILSGSGTLASPLEQDFDQNFNFILSGSTGGAALTAGTQFSASLNPANSNYLFKQLGSSADNSKSGVTAYAGTPGYTYINFKTIQTNIASATAEVAQVTFQDAVFATASLDHIADNATRTIVLTDADGEQFTLVFSGSGFNAGTGGITGSLVGMDMSGSTESSTHALGAGNAYDTISGSSLGAILVTAVNSITGSSDNTKSFSASVDSTGLIVTITYNEPGNATNIINNFGSENADTTASVSVTTQGGITGYSVASGDHVMVVTQSADIVFSGEIGQSEGYGYASTPFITTQFLDANKTTKELFKFHTLDHGKHLCHDYKISIANLREPSNIDGVEQYSTFSVIVRRTNDKDKNPVILEQFNNCNLDPDSPNYIAKVIGDRYPQYNDTLAKVELLGNYPNISNLIRVEVAAAVASKGLSPKMSPKGFKAVRDTINTASFATNFTFPSASYEGNQVVGSDYSSKAFLGFKFIDKEPDNEAFLQPLPDNNQANVSGDFNVENYSGHPSSSLWVGSLSASLDTTGTTGPTANQLKFTVPFQGGDDGIAPYTVKFTGGETAVASDMDSTYTAGTNLYGFDLSGTDKNGYKAYKKALDILSNQDEYDINMLVLPGVIKQIHNSVTNAAIDMAEGRGDAFYVMDLTRLDASVNTAVNTVDGLDTNYAAVYYPWVKVTDSRSRPVLVPPSVIVPGAIAASDRIATEWFAPAGLNRGVLGNVLEAKIRLNQAERDTLYDNKINPIATFPGTGVCIWGQKTLQERSTALDRINVRRLLISLKKYIASSSRYLVFEQNTLQTRTRFLNIVNPYLESVQQRQGLYAFRVQMDETNNTPDVIDRNQLLGAIYLQPTKTAEFIVLDFNVLPTGATFDGSGGTGGGGATGGGGTAGGGGGY